MGFTTKAFIRKNTLELQEKLKEMGYDICPCCNFQTSHWLDISIETSSIHGVSKRSIGIMLHKTDAIDCGENEKLFLALAAMRNDTNIYQWFTDGENWGYSPKTIMYNKSMPCYWTLVFDHPTNDMHMEDFIKYRKATVEEIIEHFTNE